MFNRLVNIFLFTVHFTITRVTCHLKDMGEETVNFSSVHDILEAEGRIGGGKPVDLEKFPFHAQFLNEGGLCAAIIITSKVLLTAAHCFDGNKNIANMKIFAASRYIFDHKRQEFDVWDFIIHQHYNEAVLFSNDIGVILIHKPVVFGKLAKPAVLSNGQTWMRDTKKNVFVASGWGETSYGGQLSTKGLLAARFRYIPLDKCKKIYEGMDFSPEMFCLYGDGKRDTCRGDSGGGIVWKSVVVGIVSHGAPCSELAGMYVNVYFYKGWIMEQTAELVRRYNTFHAFGAKNETSALRTNTYSEDAIVQFSDF